jgi:hypothetical protein
MVGFFAENPAKGFGFRFGDSGMRDSHNWRVSRIRLRRRGCDRLW